ncbi:MAG: MBL fold metallo-hydrolase [Bacteroidetes bacterium]|nr:MAG: MBL fold metallo-hydrolase [Bacteroidota bacterium]REK07057.1 MAG: MBL fold metallo-hydrolase [Bacteroidota bacterium]REK33597.1 MAG: MBL fold metallo-hydrolase [Bacteroidota bacterium]REK48581.1 MAG: MBL fold metallo-hydrolase [Bacteroidota bacterium]
MKLHTINTGYFKLDGGAMFGVVPKSIWQKLNPADDNNMCNWAMRCMLVETGDRLILIDNGIGDKQDEKFFSYYYLSGDDSLHGSLRKLGFTAEDITDVFLTHLHFDHCGGSVKWNSKRDGYETAFPNATYWSNEAHWEWATKPNAREKASFLKENIMPVQESGQLKFLKEGESLMPGFDVKFVNGHTEGMMLPVIEYKGKKVVYCADLIPSAGHIPLPYVMAYDTRPLITLHEKALFLKEVTGPNHVLFFEHDPKIECAVLEATEKGSRLKESFTLGSL